MEKSSLIKVLLGLIYAVETVTVNGQCTYSTLPSNHSKSCIGLITCTDDIIPVPGEIGEKRCGDSADEDYSLHLILKNILIFWSSSSFFENSKGIEGRITSISVRSSLIKRIDDMFYQFLNVTNIDFSHNGLQIFDANKFTTLKQLEVLNVSCNYISSIEGIISKKNYIESLSVLDLSYNLIEEVDSFYFEITPQIIHLNLSYNHLTHFNDIIVYLPKLQTLYLTNNKIVDFVMFDVPNLQVLRLDFNHLSNWYIYGSKKKLKIVTVSYNDIKKVETLPPGLTKLDLSHNRIEAIFKWNFRELVNLTCLDLSFNNISVVELTSFKGDNITNFKMDSNNLRGLLDKNIFEGINTHKLDLSGGNITELGSELFVGENLQFKLLNFSNNMISEIHQSAFNNLELLTKLDLSNNKLQNINLDTKSLKNLTHFFVKNNFIKKLTKALLSNLISLKFLDFSHNAIEDIDEHAFINLENLEELIIKNNPLSSTITAETFIGLKLPTHIDLSYTKITCLKNYTLLDVISLRTFNASFGDINIIEFDIFNNTTRSVKIIDLSHNQITSFLINNQNIKHVQEIYLSNNKLTHISNQTFEGLSQLIILKLDGNRIASIQTESFGTTPNVQLLNLHGNNLRSLKSDAFRGLENLKRLNLSSNRLNDITADLFYDYANLEIIALDDNVLSNIDFRNTSTPDTNLKKITLGGNLFTCYSIVKFVQFLPRVEITAENVKKYRENFQGITCRHDWMYVNKNLTIVKGDLEVTALNSSKEKSSKIDSISDGKIVDNVVVVVDNATKANGQALRREILSETDSVILNKVSELDSALYKEEGCFLAMVVLLVSFFILILRYSYKKKWFTHGTM